MKRVERFWIAFCIIGTVARLAIKPYDPFLQVIGFCGLAGWYTIAFYFLIAGTSIAGRREAGLRWPEVATGVIAGVVSGYSVLSMLLHWIGWTHWQDTLGLGGGALLLIGIPVYALVLRRPASYFYRKILLRLGMLMVCLVANVLLRPLLFPGRVLNYLNPVSAVVSEVPAI